MELRRSKEVSIKKNFIFNCILTISSAIFPLIAFPYVSRVLGPDMIGKVDFATSVIYYFNVIAQLGIPVYGIRACAQNRDNKRELSKIAEELIVINLIMSACVYIMLAISLAGIERLKRDRILIIIISFSILLNSIGIEWLYKALEKYQYITIRSLAFKIISIGLMFATIKSKSDYIMYGFLTILASSASNIMNFVHARRFLIFIPLKQLEIGKHIRPIFVFFGMSVATTVYVKLDSVMLGFMKSDIDVGLYSAAVKIRGVLLGVVTSLGTVILPRASYYIEQKQIERFYSAARKAMEFVLILSLPIMLFFVLYARDGILFLSGIEFENATLAMQIIMPTLVLVGISNITGIQMLIPMGYENIVLRSEIVGAIADFILNIVLIPRYSYVGAAIGTLVAEIVVLGVQILFLKDKLSMIFSDINWILIVLAAIVSGMMSGLLKMINIKSVFVRLVSGGIMFFVTYLIVLLIFKEPIIKELIGDVRRKLNYRRK